MGKTLIHIALKIVLNAILIIILPLVTVSALGQVLPPDRRVNWEKANQDIDFPITENILDILDYGGDREGQNANDSALRDAIGDLNGQYGIIHFPAGTYLFNETVQLKDSTLLRGDGAGKTNFQFDLGGKGHLINVEGFATGNYNLAQSAAFGTNQIILGNKEGLKSGDFIRVYQNDDAVIASDWALNSTGQISQIIEITDQGLLTLSDPLRMDYEMGLAPAVEKVHPVTGAGVSCLKIERSDATTRQTSNINFRYAIGCRVQGIESNRCNFSHVTMSYSYHIKISGSYFHHAFAYGGGGKAYGVVAQFSSGNCLVENNIFEHLRHAMLLQAGANGNVFAYNYSVEPFWEETLSPSDAAGDLVLHGNYPYANLFEGNIGQNIIIDNSHEINGPINTFFRNRGESYGFIMFPNPPSDKQNIIGNEITSPESSKGIFLTFGNDHLIHGNRVKGGIIPENTTTVDDTSYYLTEKPGFLGNYKWPAIGLPNQANFYSIPAKNRHLRGGPLALCGSEIPVVTGFGRDSPNDSGYSVYPNPGRGIFTVDIGSRPGSPVGIQVVDVMGQVVFSSWGNERLNKINLDNQPPGLYFIKTYRRSRLDATLKVIVY